MQHKIRCNIYSVLYILFYFLRIGEGTIDIRGMIGGSATVRIKLRNQSLGMKKISLVNIFKCSTMNQHNRYKSNDR